MAPFKLGIWTYLVLFGDMEWASASWGYGFAHNSRQPVASWGYGKAPFHVGIWHTPFVVGDMDSPYFNREYELPHFKLGMWTLSFLFGDMDRLFSTWEYELPHFKLGICTSTELQVARFKFGIWNGPLARGDIAYPLCIW